MRKNVALERLTITQRRLYDYDVLDGMTAEEVKQFMHEEALKLDELADPALATLNVDVDIYYSNTDVRLALNTTRLETDAEFTERVEQAKAAKAANEAAAKQLRRERRQQIKREELQLLAKLKAKYER